MIRIYLCEDSLPGILTAVSTAYEERRGHANNKIQVREEGLTAELFSEYQDVETDPEKAEKVYRAIYEKIGADALGMVESVALSHEEGKGELIYRFLILGFANGPAVTAYVKDLNVYQMLKVNRRISNESHHWVEFLRFQVYDRLLPERKSNDLLPVLLGGDQSNEILIARIGPKEKVLPRVMPHFADRFHGATFLIYDETHDMLGIYRPGLQWVLYEQISGVFPEIPELFSRKNETERQMEDLWKVFFEATDIKERENLKVQRNLLPLWHRKYMTEFN
ncbi:MAG: TIGR03915 family putative DNA repair protein [Lachnospiraceae bacterium]|nr:TIGR03915 family putative DNA repair protein [Lachnospiraceae bacterium]